MTFVVIVVALCAAFFFGVYVGVGPDKPEYHGNPLDDPRIVSRTREIQQDQESEARKVRALLH